MGEGSGFRASGRASGPANGRKHRASLAKPLPDRSMLSLSPPPPTHTHQPTHPPTHPPRAGAFAFVFYPLRDQLHPTEWAANLLDTMGPRWAGPIAIVRNWTCERGPQRCLCVIFCKLLFPAMLSFVGRPIPSVGRPQGVC